MVSSFCCLCRVKRIATIEDGDQEQQQDQQQQEQQQQDQQQQEEQDKKINVKKKGRELQVETSQSRPAVAAAAASKKEEPLTPANSMSSSSVYDEEFDAEEEREVLLTRYAAELKRLKEDSGFFEEHSRSPHPIPTFRFDELEIGPMLGIGGFCTVREVTGFTLLKQDDHQPDTDRANHSGHENGHENEIGNENDTGNDNDNENDIGHENGMENEHAQCEDNNPPDSKPPTTNPNPNSNTNARSGIDIQFANSSTRTYMSQNTLRDSNARYAIKQLRNNLVQPYDFYDNEGNRKRSRKAVHWRGMLDLAIEAQFLSVLSHPNIVKMRGVAACRPLIPTCPANIHSTDPLNHDADQPYFLILDRLFGTLQEVIDDRWKSEKKAMDKSGSFFGDLLHIVTKNNTGSAHQMKLQMQKEMFLERMTVAYDVASAFRFLHSKRLIYRDIKSANIGFDVRGDIKIFDFGLCKELPNKSIPATQATRRTGPLYKLTARTGSRPYMAPEILLGKPYNQKADVFSFGILLYEIFALKLPFEGFTNQDYRQRVFSNIRYRPKLGKEWPTVMKALLDECWDNDLSRRPDFERIASVLKAEMADMVDDLNINRSGSVKNRTAHLLNRSAASRHNRMMSAAAGDVAAPGGGGGVAGDDISQRSSHYRLALDDVEEDED